MQNLSRREFIAILSALGIAPASLGAVDSSDNSATGPFRHGIASGDPLHDRVILWTRVIPAAPGDAIHGKWSIASDPQMKRVWRSGRFSADASRDFTVKIDADGLESGSTYYYQFEARGARSAVGRTCTLRVGSVDRLRFAFASCSNYPQGYFNAYRRIAERQDLNFVVHLGDYLYEYKLGEYADKQLAGMRDVVPTHEAVTLADYRLRHALYKSDPDLQEAHRQHPFICVWDDHEFANDSYRDGAENHNPERGEGDWQVRRRAAVRAYDEYMPIRTRGEVDATIYRRFAIGDLADLVMLDTRIHGRDKQAIKGDQPELPAADPVVADPKRTLLGFDQEAWLERQLVESKERGATWRILGQQVMMAQLSPTNGRTIRNPDQWDGYGPARERLFSALRTRGIRNNVVLTGDIHSSWCNDLTSNPWDAYDSRTGAGVVGVEFIGPAISSPALVMDPVQAKSRTEQLYNNSPHIRYVDLMKRGYCVLDVDRNRALCEVYHVPRVDVRAPGEELAAAFASEPGSNNALKRVGPAPTITPSGAAVA